MILNNSPLKINFLSTEERLEFIRQSKVAGIYNDATICFVETTGEFWSVLKDKKIKLSKYEVRQMGICTSFFKKESNK